MNSLFKLVLALFARNETSGVTEPVDKTNDGRNALKVQTELVQPLTDAQLRASAPSVNTGLSQPLTDTQLRATPVPVSGTVTANTGLSQPLTDAQLRASPPAVDTGLSQPLTDAQLRASAVPVSGPLTDAQLRASPPTVTVGNFPATQPVSGTVNVGNLPATQPVSGTVTANQGTAGASPWPVTGTVNVGNFPATQPVSGTINVGNFPATQPVSIADGSNVTQGAKADTAATDSTSSWSVVAILKGIWSKLAASLTVVQGTPNSQPIANAWPVYQPASEDVFGNLITGAKNNQTEVHFDDVGYTTYVTNTATNGGTATQSAGSVTYASGTNTNGRIQALSVDSTVYRAYHELYAAWTAAWPQGGLANSYQRIGLGDAGFVDGVQSTFEGTTFGLIYFCNSVSTFVAQTSWNVDKCGGAAGSQYTLNGTPVVMDTTKKQVFAVRAGLLGSHTLEVWVSSPDRHMIPVHVFSHPNLVATAIFTNFDLPMLVDVNKTVAGASNISIVTACWAGGSTSYLSRITDALSDRSMAQTVRAVLTGRTTAAGSSYVNVKVNPSGAVQVGGLIGVEGADGTNIASRTNPVPTLDSAQLVQAAYDYISLGSYTTDNQPQSVVFKTGGSAGTTVATLTLAYANGSAGGNLTSVTKS